MRESIDRNGVCRASHRRIPTANKRIPSRLILVNITTYPPLFPPSYIMVFSIAARSATSGALRSAALPAARAAARPAVWPAGLTLGRRGYAEAVSDKLKLSFILPHAVGIEVTSCLLGTVLTKGSAIEIQPRKDLRRRFTFRAARINDEVTQN